MSWFIAFIFFVLSSLLVYSLIRAAVKFAPWFPTRKSDYERIWQLTQLKEGQTFYDLGCGLGGVTLFMAAKGVRAVGIEYVFPLFALAWLRARWNRSFARILWRDFFKQDLSDADVIFLFGLSETLTQEFYARLSKACRPKTRIVTYVFGFSNIKPLLISKPDNDTLSIYVYET